MTKHLSIFIFILLFIGCNKKHEPKAVYYGEEVKDVNIDSLLSDTSKVLMAEFPMFFDSTRILIHPIGFVNIENKLRSSKHNKSSYEDFDYGMKLGYENNEINGNLTYLVFEDVDNNIIRPLSNKVLNISHVKYLRELARKTDRHYLLYRLQDKDTNRDEKIDNKDISSLYLSKLDGSGFTKITSEGHQIDNAEWRNWCSRYYFRTLEDVNKDGKFDKKDKYHYYYINFSTEPYKVIEYNPFDKVLN